MSFSNKVILYAMAVSVISLLLSGLSFITYDIKETRQGLVSTTELQADMIANASVKALIDKNAADAFEMTDAVGSDRYVQGAWIYSSEYTLFSSYDPNKIGFDVLPESYRQPGAYFDENQLTVVRSIKVGPRLLGMVAVTSTLNGVHTRAIYQVTTVIVVMLISLFGALLLSIRFQRSLTRPLVALLATLEKVSETNDYSLQAQKLSNDDLGVLTDAFNKMLNEVNSKTDALRNSEERLHLAMWGSNEVLFDWDLVSDQLYFDNAIEQVLGYDIHHAPKSLDEYILIIHPSDLDHFQKTLASHLKGDSPHFESEYRVKNDSGEYRWLLTRGKVVERDKKGQPHRLTGTFGDVTVRKEAEEELKLFHKVFSSTTEAVVVTDKNLKIVQCNHAFNNITGYELDDLKGKSIEVLYSDLHPASFYHQIRNSIENEKSWQGELTQRRKSGEDFPSHLSLNAMLDDQGTIIHYVGVFGDLTSIKKNEEKVDYLTHYDPLTNVPNRELLKSMLNRIIHVSSQSNETFGLIVVGLDNFKLINDSSGHVIGDELLKMVAHRLSQLVKSKSQIARIGGDEFALIIDRVQNSEQLKVKAEEILAVMSSRFIIQEQEIIVGCCIGLSIYPRDGQEMGMLLMNADTAMLQAKKEQRNSYQFFTQSMTEAVTMRQNVESLLRKAIERDELKLFYQPKVDTISGKVIGAEALLRWFSKDAGMIGPDKFIPIAEETGLIVPIGDWVFKQACMQGQIWHNLGWFNFSMAINVSGIQFKKDDFLEKIQKIIHETGFNPQYIDLEITEGALMADVERCILVLKMLKSMGVHISVDDFGTGYSSLSYLRKFPLDTIKIDQSFVRKMMSSQEDAHIVSAVIDMASGLKLKTVAEGVEEVEQLERLKVLGCDIIQGYYYSKPIPASEFEQFYTKHNQDLQKKA